MKSFTATVVGVSNLTAEFNKHYGYHLAPSDFNFLIYNDKYAEGIRPFYFGSSYDIEPDTQLSEDLCEFLSEEFPDLDAIYIDCEALW